MLFSWSQKHFFLSSIPNFSLLGDMKDKEEKNWLGLVWLLWPITDQSNTDLHVNTDRPMANVDLHIDTDGPIINLAMTDDEKADLRMIEVKILVRLMMFLMAFKKLLLCLLKKLI